MATYVVREESCFSRKCICFCAPFLLLLAICKFFIIKSEVKVSRLAIYSQNSKLRAGLHCFQLFSFWGWNRARWGAIRRAIRSVQNALGVLRWVAKKWNLDASASGLGNLSSGKEYRTGFLIHQKDRIRFKTETGAALSDTLFACLNFFLSGFDRQTLSLRTRTD